MSLGSQERLQSPPAVARLPDGYDSWDQYMLEIENGETAWRDEEAQRGIAAWLLSPTSRIYQALMRGEDVPVAALDPQWAGRYGLL